MSISVVTSVSDDKCFLSPIYYAAISFPMICFQQPPACNKIAFSRADYTAATVHSSPEYRAMGGRNMAWQKNLIVHVFSWSLLMLGWKQMREQIWEASLTIQEQALCLYIGPNLGDYCINGTKPLAVMCPSYAALNTDDYEHIFTDQMLSARSPASRVLTTKSILFSPVLLKPQTMDLGHLINDQI